MDGKIEIELYEDLEFVKKYEYVDKLIEINHRFNVRIDFIIKIKITIIYDEIDGDDCTDDDDEIEFS